MRKPPVVVVKEMELYEVHAGDDHFLVAAPEYAGAVYAIGQKYKGKTLEDIPKPFLMERKTDIPNILVVLGKKR